MVAVERDMLSRAAAGTPGSDDGAGPVEAVGMATHDAPGAEVEKLREQLVMARARVEELEEALETEREATTADNKELKVWLYSDPLFYRTPL